MPVAEAIFEKGEGDLCLQNSEKFEILKQAATRNRQVISRDFANPSAVGLASSTYIRPD
jgi:hypothetical protein